MADPRFFNRAAPKTLGELAEISGADIGSGSDSSRIIHDVAALDKAGATDISFLDNIKYRDQFAVTKASACIVSPDMVEFAPVGMALLVTKTPYKTYAYIAQAFYPNHFPASSVSPHAHVHSSAILEDGCVIGHGAVVEEGAVIGSGSWIEPNAVIGRNVVIGKATRIGANSVITHALIGSNVHIYPGCCIGQDGFGFAIDPKGHIKIPQLGRVVIEDSVQIGSGCAIDRGSGPDTVIGQGTWMDNLIQVGHNVKIGRCCVIAGQCGISGSTVLEDYVVLAGQVGVAGHLTIGKGARIAAKSGLLRDVPAGAEQMGYPAVPIKQFFKQTAYISRLVTKKA